MKFKFDSPEDNTLWHRNTTAIIAADPTAPTQPNSFTFQWGLGPEPSAYRYITGLVHGQQYPLWLRLNCNGMSSGTPYLAITYDDGNGGNFAINRYSIDPGWRALYLGIIIANTSNSILRLDGSIAPVIGYFAIDEIAIGEPVLPVSYIPELPGQTKIKWQTWHLDDIMGTPMPHEDAVRDRYGRLVDVYQSLDEHAHDEIIQQPRPTERVRKDP